MHINNSDLGSMDVAAVRSITAHLTKRAPRSSTHTTFTIRCDTASSPTAPGRRSLARLPVRGIGLVET